MPRWFTGSAAVSTRAAEEDSQYPSLLTSWAAHERVLTVHMVEHGAHGGVMLGIIGRSDPAHGPPLPLLPINYGFPVAPSVP
jgi:hypothetical protein